MISGQGMFVGTTVGSVGYYVAVGIMRLVSLEVVEGLCPAPRHRSVVTVARIVAVIDVANKAVGAVEPGPAPIKIPPANQSGP